MQQVFRSVVSMCLAVCLTAGVALASDPVPLKNWPVPTATRGEGTISSMADLSQHTIFMPVTPCRVVDTRNAMGPYGGPKMVSGTTRTFDVDASSCTGIPNGAAAFSLNFSVTETAAQGFLTAWNTGAAQPGVATMTWFAANQTLTNAAVVPAGGSGQINVFVAATTHVIIDINGYFMANGGVLNTDRHLIWLGNVSSSLGLMFIRNDNNTATTSAIYGFLASNAQTNSSAVKGEAAASSGITYGVHGKTNSTTNTAAGVFGQAGTAAWTSFLGGTLFGVRGIANGSSFQAGVIGESTSNGVVGIRTDAAGALQTIGRVGATGSDGFQSSNNLTVSGVKSFVEPHPTDPQRVIKYVALEGPEAGTYFRGRGRFHAGLAVIDVPEVFSLVSDEESITVQVTAIGQTASVAVIEANLDRIVVKSSRDVEFFYLVNGVRKMFRDFQPIQLNPEEAYFVPVSPEDRLQNWAYSPQLRERLIANGTFNPDGSVNMQTAERAGWAQNWRDAAAAAAAAAAKQPETDR